MIISTRYIILILTLHPLMKMLNAQNILPPNKTGYPKIGGGEEPSVTRRMAGKLVNGLEKHIKNLKNPTHWSSCFYPREQTHNGFTIIVQKAKSSLSEDD